jgi:hypothetical protein
MRAEILSDIIKIAMKSYPPPAFSDEVAVEAWVAQLAGGLTHVAYDVIGTGPSPHVLAALVGEAPPTDEDIERAYRDVMTEGGFAAAPEAGGKIIDFLKEIDWATVIKTIIAIISVIPK